MTSQTPVKTSETPCIFKCFHCLLSFLAQPPPPQYDRFPREQASHLSRFVARFSLNCCCCSSSSFFPYMQAAHRTTVAVTVRKDFPFCCRLRCFHFRIDDHAGSEINTCNGITWFHAQLGKLRRARHDKFSNFPTNNDFSLFAQKQFSKTE
jgi:hypothetical protein